MRGILADVNCVGHANVLLVLLRDETRGELWDHLGLTVFTFEDLGLTADASDRTIWEACQSQQVALITANRNAEGPDSLEIVIQDLNRSGSLPVFTFADPERILRDREYVERAADRLLDYLFDIDSYHGTGRLFIP